MLKFTKNRITEVIVSIALASLLFSCVKKQINSHGLKDYIANEENGVVKKVRRGSLEVKLSYHPADLLVLQERKEDMDSLRIQQLIKKYSGQYYFIMSISEDSKEILGSESRNNHEFSEILQTLSFRMAEHLILIADSDTIPLADYSLNRTFGMAKGTSLLLAFEKPSDANLTQVKIHFSEFGLGIGAHSLEFTQKDIDEIPRVNLYQ